MMIKHYKSISEGDEMNDNTQIKLKILEVKQRIERKKLVDRLKTISCVKNFKISIDNPSFDKYKALVRKIYKYEYPVKWHFKFYDEECFIDDFMESLAVKDKSATLIFSYGMANCWFEVEVISYKKFLTVLFNGRFNFDGSNSFEKTIIDVSNKLIFDIEYGEDCYELRVLNF